MPRGNSAAGTPHGTVPATGRGSAEERLHRPPAEAHFHAELEVDHAGERHRCLRPHARRRARGTRRRPVATGGPQRQVPAGGMAAGDDRG